MELALWEILLAAGGLSLDVFAYCLWKGAMLSELNRRNITKMVALFTACQMGAMLLGNGITLIPALRSHVQGARMMWIVIAALIFFGIGAYMIVKSFIRKRTVIEEKKEDTYNFRMIFFWALLASLDSLLAGISFGFLSVTLWVEILLTGIATCLAAIWGVLLGYRLGCGPRNTLITIGGCIVAIGGVDVLVHFFI